MSEFQCDICSSKHELPLSLAFAMPDFVNKLLPWEREKRCQMSADWCIVDDSLYYIRGCLDVAIEGTGDVFSWGVWATLGVDDFDRTMELWDNPQRVEELPYEGTIANTMPSYAETRGVNVQVITRAVGERPLIRVVDQAHKLASEQKTAMPLARAIELAKHVLHAQSKNPWDYLCQR